MTTTKQKATARVWKFGGQYVDEAYVVRAVNSHDALVEALINMVALASPQFTDSSQLLAIKLARAAINLAEGA